MIEEEEYLMLSDHRAFLFDKAKNLLVIPARVVRQDSVQDKKLSGDQPQVWYGAYVFGVKPDTGFVLRGTVEHGTGGSGYYYYGSSHNEVKRLLYIGDIPRRYFSVIWHWKRA